MEEKISEEELRRARRVNHMGRVSMFGERGFRAVAYLKDLSTTGCQVISDIPLQVGMELRLSLFVVTDECDIVIEQAKVRWANGDRFGLEVQAFDPQERERLRLFLKTVVKPAVPDAAGK
ncbi:MAG: PilZ domain-containing protein [Nitrospira sp.]|nr:PilZ domain-containing protein [Nitrospira sp.]